MPRLRILVVDDDPTMTQLLVELLRAWSCEAAGAWSLDEALGLLAARSFDLVLSDLYMPPRSGFELLERIRSSWPDTAVILMSSFPAQETKKQALDAGALAFLSKPFSLDVLQEMVEGLASRPR